MEGTKPAIMATNTNMLIDTIGVSDPKYKNRISMTLSESDTPDIV
jgi:hypothetical protein